MTAVETRLATGAHAAKVAALTLWVPVLVPIVTGMLGGSSHALQNYLLCLPLVPGIIVPTLLQLDDAWYMIVAGLATLLLFAVVCWLLSRLRRGPAIAVQVAVVLAVTFEAIGFANALLA